MKTRTYVLFAATIFAIVAGAHAVRAALQLPLHIGTADIPLWASWVGALGAGVLSALGFTLARRS